MDDEAFTKLMCKDDDDFLAATLEIDLDQLNKRQLVVVTQRNQAIARESRDTLQKREAGWEAELQDEYNLGYESSASAEDNQFAYAAGFHRAVVLWNLPQPVSKAHVDAELEKQMRHLFSFIETCDDPSEFPEPLTNCHEEGHQYRLVPVKHLPPHHATQAYWKEFKKLHQALEKKRKEQA